MCAIAFFAFLGIGEITASRSDATNLIDITQLDRLVDDRGISRALQLTICNYKHKKSGPPFVTYLSRSDLLSSKAYIKLYIYEGSGSRSFVLLAR